MSNKIPIVIAKGDGIGPEIMDATLSILSEAGAELEYHPIDIGEKVYLAGNKAGIAPESWGLLRQTKVFLKAPITTPQGGGYKSLNVTARKALGLYANVRPAVAYMPFVESKYPKMDLVIVRENEEGMYVGVEHQQTPDQVQALKIISRPGAERICLYAFEYARRHGRKKVTAFVKDNIMKMTDGLFHKIYDQVAQLYPDIQSDHWIVDIGMAKMADTPEAFDVIVMPNLYGDIASDVAAQIAGSVGLAGSANIGDQCAMFEAIHGSAPRRAGQNLANPSGLLHGAILMLIHIGQADVAARVHNAWLKTLEDGVHTYDIAKEGSTSVGTKEFARGVIERLGKKPQTLKTVDYSNQVAATPPPPYKYISPQVNRELIGADISVFSPRYKAKSLGEILSQAALPQFELKAMFSRGMQVYPAASDQIFTVDQFAARFLRREGKATHAEIRELLQRIENAKVEWVRLEGLYQMDGVATFSN